MPFVYKYVALQTFESLALCKVGQQIVTLLNHEPFNISHPSSLLFLNRALYFSHYSQCLSRALPLIKYTSSEKHVLFIAAFQKHVLFIAAFQKHRAKTKGR